MTSTSPDGLLQLNAARALIQQRRKDSPLDYWSPSSEGQEWFIRSVLAGNDTYGHTGNRGGKTTAMIALLLALLQGREFLHARDGGKILLPVLEPPVNWALLGETFKLIGAGAMFTLKELLGAWDATFHDEHEGCPSFVRIRHRLARKEEEWSRLYVFPYNGPEPEGPGLDGASCDECPPVHFLGALRTRLRAGRKLRICISATPKLKKDWLPVLEQYPDEECVVEGGRARVRWSVFDNDALSPDEKESLRLGAAGDDFEMARLYGDHVDMTGSSPWQRYKDILTRWLLRCTEPEMERVTVQSEQTSGGDRIVREIACTVETWAKYDYLDSYLMLADVASGIRDGKHDPDGIHIWSIRRNALVLRVNEPMGPFALGNLCARLQKEWGNCLFEPFVNGGYGLSLLSSFRQAGGSNISRERFYDRVNARWSERLGWTETTQAIDEAIASMERSLVNDSCGIWSRPVVRSLMDVRRDDKGKIIPGELAYDSLGKINRGGHAHGEDLRLTGRAQLVIGRIKGNAPLIETATASIPEIVARELGRPVRKAPVTVVPEAW